MHWTATHRFVFLALHMSATDFQVQEPEKRALTEAARRIGVSAGIPLDAAQQMIYDACDWFYDTEDRDAKAGECVRHLAEAFRVGSPVLRALHTYLRTVAESNKGLDGAEEAWLNAVSAEWGI